MRRANEVTKEVVGNLVNKNQQPELETRRAMLTQMRDNFRAQGFEAEMNAVAIGVQIGSEDDTQGQQEKMIRDYRGKAQNCYLSAEHLSEQLSKLPKPKKEA